MAPILSREEWKTRVTGQADFKWAFSPAEINFEFTGPHVEGLGYQASNVRARGVYEPSAAQVRRQRLRVTELRPPHVRHSALPGRGRPLSYTLAGTFRNLDMRRLPARLAMPKLDTQAAGRI